MATQAEIRQRIYNYLFGVFPTESPFASRLTASINSSTTTIPVLDGTQWGANDVLEMLDTGEQMKVLSISTNNLTVIRGWNGTTAAASIGSADAVYKNPRFTVAQIDTAIESTLHALEAWSIHALGEGDITRADPVRAYELSETDIMEHLGVITVHYQRLNTLEPQRIPFIYERPLGSFTGPTLHILDWGHQTNGDTVEFIYAKKILDVTELLDRQTELVVVGATANLLGATIAPATHDPGARSDRTTQPGQTSRDVRYFQGRFFTEARTETALLAVERQRLVRTSIRQSRARRWVT